MEQQQLINTMLLFTIGYLIHVIADFIPRKKPDYQKYIKSHAWRKKRLKRLRLDKWRCQHCDADLKRVTPNVHHKTYKRLGRERMRDLISLCQPCHNKVHKK